MKQRSVRRRRRKLQHAVAILSGGCDRHQCQLRALPSERCDVLCEPIAIKGRQVEVDILHQLNEFDPHRKQGKRVSKPP